MKRIERVTCWLGFYSGILLLRNPSDITSFRNWFSVSFTSIYYVFINILIITFTLLESEYATYAYPQTFIQNGRKNLENFVAVTLMVLQAIFDTSMRFSFFCNGKNIPQFFLKVKGRYFDINNSGFILKATWFHHLVVWMSLILTFSKAGLWTISTTSGSQLSNNGTANNYNLDWIPFSDQLIYKIFLFSFVAIPYELTGVITYNFILLSTIYTQYVFDQFCHTFQNEIEILLTRKNPENDPCEKLELEKQQIPPGIFLLLDELKLAWIEKNTAKRKLLKHLDFVLDIFSLYDRINGPLLVALVCETCITLVEVMDNLLVHELTTLEKVHEWNHLATRILRLYLLQVGHKFHRNVSFINHNNHT